LKAFLDAPLPIYLNTISDPSSRAQYENLYIYFTTKYKLYTDVLVLDEVLYISKKKYGVPYDLTAEFLKTVVFPYVSVIDLAEEEFKQALRLVLEHNLKPSDALHMGAMKAMGINNIISEDRDFDRTGEVKRIWL
jgi:predicted nucleic acid-binding protein